MLRSATGLFKLIALLATPFAVSPDKGAATCVHVASSPGSGGISGKYFTNSRITKVNTKFITVENRELLWNISMKSLLLSQPVSSKRF
jgi:hypothetical protein